MHFQHSYYFEKCCMARQFSESWLAIHDSRLELLASHFHLNYHYHDYGLVINQIHSLVYIDNNYSYIVNNSCVYIGSKQVH
jgi:hypothetical protein